MLGGVDNEHPSRESVSGGPDDTRRHKVVRVRCCTIIIVLIGLGLGAAARAQDSAFLRALRGAYEENRSKFPFGTIHFTFTSGTSDDSTESRLGRARVAYNTTGHYAYSGKNAIYSRVFSDEDMRATSFAISEIRTGQRLNSIRALTDGTVTLLDRVSMVKADPPHVLHNAKIVAGMTDFYREIEIPLNLGYPEDVRDDLGSAIHRALVGSKGVRIIEVDDRSEYEGSPAVRLVFEFEYGVSTCWIDLDHGAVPRYIKFIGKDGLPIEEFYDDVRQIEGHGWLPHVKTLIIQNRLLRRLEIRSADFDTRPGRLAFRLEFDEPISLTNEVKGLVYPPSKEWNLFALPTSGTPGVARYETSHVPLAPMLPGERQTSSWWPWMALIIAIAILVVVVVLRRAYR
jgi:hypothetical protein